MKKTCHKPDSNMSRKLPNFRDWDDSTRANPCGWDYGHGKKRTRVTFKTKKQKQDYRKAFEDRWFSDRHAVLSFDSERWRKYEELELKLKKSGASIETAVNFYFEHAATRREKIPLFSELVEERIEDLKRKQSPTLNHAKLYCQEFIAFAGDRTINMYTRDDVQAKIDKLIKSGASFHTCKNHLRQIAVIFNKALHDGYIERLPTSRVQLPTTRGEKRLELIEPADLRRLLEYAWQRDRPMAGHLAILFFTGMRISMIAVPHHKKKRKEWLRLDMIDFEHRAIVIPQGIMKSGVEHIIDDAPECLWSWIADLKASDFGMHQNIFNDRKREILKATGVKWPPNLHRRSFGSYLGALKGRDYAAQIMADKSESVFVKHYQVPTFKKIAEEYVNIFRKN
jgi:hypothetical protein